MGIAALVECEAVVLAAEVAAVALSEAVPVLVPVVVEPEPVEAFVMLAVEAETEAPVEAETPPVPV